MSVERAREFLEAAASDPAIRAWLDGAGSRQEGREAVRAAGYGDVTAEDLKAVLATRAGAQRELTDEELGAASGGLQKGDVVAFIFKNASRLVGLFE